MHPSHMCWTWTLPWMLGFILRGGKYWCIAPQWWSKLISQSTGPNNQGILKIQICDSFVVIYCYKWRQTGVSWRNKEGALPTKNTKSDVQQIMCLKTTAKLLAPHRGTKKRGGYLKWFTKTINGLVSLFCDNRLSLWEEYYSLTKTLTAMVAPNERTRDSKGSLHNMLRLNHLQPKPWKYWISPCFNHVAKYPKLWNIIE